MIKKHAQQCILSLLLFLDKPLSLKEKKTQTPENTNRTKIGSFLKIKKDRDSLRLLRNSWLRPEVIVCSSSNIYKRIAKKTDIRVSRRHENSNKTDNNINFKTDYHSFYSNKFTI